MVHVQDNINRRNPRSQRRLRPGMYERRVRQSGKNYPSRSDDLHEAVSMAHDPSVHLPTEWAKPSLLRRQTIDQSWMRWKAREAEDMATAQREKLFAEKQKWELELDLFGGDVGDDELRALGILYEPKPDYNVRFLRPRRRRNAPTQALLPPILAVSILSDDAEILRFMSQASQCSPPTIGKKSIVEKMTPPQSLPPLSESIFSTPTVTFANSRSASSFSLSTAFPIPLFHTPQPQSPSLSIDMSWDYIHVDTTPGTPIPEMGTENWTLLSDDS